MEKELSRRCRPRAAAAATTTAAIGTIAISVIIARTLLGVATPGVGIILRRKSTSAAGALQSAQSSSSRKRHNYIIERLVKQVFLLRSKGKNGGERVLVDNACSANGTITVLLQNGLLFFGGGGQLRITQKCPTTQS